MNTEIKSQIQKLLDKTKEEKIDWKQINQNAIRWTSYNDSTMYIVTIQTTLTGVVVAGKQLSQYIMTIQSNSGEMILQLQSNDETNSDLKPLLEELFLIATTKAKEESINILNRLLDKI